MKSIETLPRHIHSGIRVDEHGCWMWTRSVQADGYAATSHRGKRFLAHRLTYTLLVGEIPEGMVLDHTCHDPRQCVSGVMCLHRRCLNPAHLEVVSRLENTLRGARAQSTTCPNGHPYTPENTVRKTEMGRSYRRCMTCLAARGEGVGRPTGERHPRAKFTDAQIGAIRQLRAEGVPVAQLAAHFGMAGSYVYKITRYEKRSK